MTSISLKKGNRKVVLMLLMCTLSGCNITKEVNRKEQLTNKTEIVKEIEIEVPFS